MTFSQRQIVEAAVAGRGGRVLVDGVDLRDVEVLVREGVLAPAGLIMAGWHVYAVTDFGRSLLQGPLFRRSQSEAVLA